MSDLLQVEQRERVLWIALNRVAKRNALSLEMCQELADAVHRGNKDPHIGAIVLAGNGPVFSAGMDLEEVARLNPQSLSNVHEQLFTMGTRLGKPLIAAVGGAALGGGFGLVANCHIVIAGEGAKFGLTEIRLGLWPFLVFQAVQLAVGERRAVELALTGRVFDAREAKEMNLAQEVAPDAAARAMEVAKGLAESSPTAIRNGLSFVQEARNQSPATAVEVARRTREDLFASPDFHEGIKAFLEKRAPKWPSLTDIKPNAGEPTP